MRFKKALFTILILAITSFCVVLGYNALVYFQEQRKEVEELKKQNRMFQEQINESKSKLGKEEACRKEGELLNQIKDTCGMMPFPGVDECIKKRQDAANWINWQPRPEDPLIAAQYERDNLDRVAKMQQLKEQYLYYKAKCKG